MIDPNINSRQMEMYADPNSRGGVLEAEGIVSIKLRMKEQRRLMERLDPEMSRMAEEIKSPDLVRNENDQMARIGGSLWHFSQQVEERRLSLEESMRKREEILAPMYHQVAVHFADLHDTPTRMKEKGVIRDIVPWEDAR